MEEITIESVYIKTHRVHTDMLALTAYTLMCSCFRKNGTKTNAEMKMTRTNVTDDSR